MSVVVVRVAQLAGHVPADRNSTQPGESSDMIYSLYCCLGTCLHGEPMDHAAEADLIRQGVDLFNRGEYYACHEAFEEAWLGARGHQRLFIQGLIQVAVALHHLTQGNAAGARRLLAEGLAKLRAHEPAQNWVEVAGLLSRSESVLQALQSGGPVKLNPAPQIKLKQE